MPKKVDLDSLVFNELGGSDLIINHLDQIKIWDKINEKLGTRAPRAEYTHGDVIQTWVINILCGSKRLEHTYRHRDKLLAHPKLKKGMSPDTISRVFRSLAVENKYYGKKESKNKIILDPTEEQKQNGHEVNVNYKLNALILDVAIELGLFNKVDSYPLDIDATVINTDISDSRFHFKKEYGYCPMVVMFGGIPIYCEARNGNSNAAFALLDTLKDAIKLIESRGLNIKFVRSDGAASSIKMVSFLVNRNLKFFIRTYGKGLESKVDALLEFKPLKNSRTEAADSYVRFGKEDIRMVNYQKIQRSKKDKHAGILSRWALYTNDYNLTEQEVIKTYNARGDIERRFADLNQFGWFYPPHRELKYNTVYLLISMLAFIIFVYLKKVLSKKVSFVRKTMLLYTFINNFMQVLTTWAEDKIHFLTRKKEFGKLTGFI